MKFFIGVALGAIFLTAVSALADYSKKYNGRAGDPGHFGLISPIVQSLPANVSQGNGPLKVSLRD